MPHNNTQSSSDWLELIRQKVQSLRFGVVQIVVHDSRVTQIERTEKTRLQSAQDDLESYSDFDSSVDDDNDDAWLLNRFRLGLAVKPVSWLKIYGQTQDAREAFSDRANIPGVRSAEGDDEFDLRQAYVAIGDTKKFP